MCEEMGGGGGGGGGWEVVATKFLMQESYLVSCVTLYFKSGHKDYLCYCKKFVLLLSFCIHLDEP